MSNIRLSKDMIGNKVRCTYKNGLYYPEVGTIGTIVQYDSYDESHSYKVQWPKGSTIGDNRWWVYNDYIDLVEDDKTSKQEIPDMTNEEIWKMLKPKMEKNGLNKKMGGLHIDKNLVDGFWVYSIDNVHNAIALAYRSGYERAMKGRPFKIGEKKKKSRHWVPVDLNNLPKEGTKVRYSRESISYKNKPEFIKLGEIGKFKLGKYTELPGIEFDDGRFWDWVCFSNEIDCLDMWVEDDE